MAIIIPFAIVIGISILFRIWEWSEDRKDRKESNERKDPTIGNLK